MQTSDKVVRSVPTPSVDRRRGLVDGWGDTSPTVAAWSLGTLTPLAGSGNSPVLSKDSDGMLTLLRRSRVHRPLDVALIEKENHFKRAP
ncbi:hypothetical protein D9615_010375 [Tricholomella constricta]|uniref:Uncharacterized protein n=1 Tax=Tricholomella constricta TaxID=117010 RepID=A0A8H5LSW2_9AGAR|nr:hypothetical protein D9615_010375 [Tricholomella constricta]